MPWSLQVTIRLWMMPTCLAPSSVQQKSHDRRLWKYMHNRRYPRFVIMEGRRRLGQNRRRRGRCLGPVPHRRAGWCLQGLQGPIFHLQIGLDISMSGDRAFVPEPQGNDRDVNARLQHMHRDRVTDQVWENPPLGQLGESMSGALDGKLQPFCETDTRQWSTGSTWEQRLLRRTGILS